MGVKSNSVDMINGPLKGKILKFAVLFMMTALLQHLYSAADTIVVGRFAGQEALAGVGTCTVLVNACINFILGLSAGTTIALGQALGFGDTRRIEKIVHTAIAIAAFGGLVVAIVYILFAKQFLSMIDVPNDVIPQALIYLRTVALGFPFSLIYNFGAGMLRAKGDAKRPLYIVSASGIINVGLNIFFVCAFKMQADGVALATVISHIFSAVSVLYILCHEQDDTKITLRRVRFYKEPFLRILRYGIPSGIQSSVYSVSNILVQTSVNSFGATAIAGSAACASITEFYGVAGSSLYNSAIVFSSQNYGAKRFDNIKKIAIICTMYAMCAWAMQSAATYLFGEELIGLYAPGNAAVIEMGVRKINIVGYWYGVLAVMNIMSGLLRGMGRSVMNMVTSIVGVCGIRILWIVTVFKMIGTYESLFVCYPLSWTGTLLLHFMMFLFVFRKEKKNNEIMK